MQGLVTVFGGSGFIGTQVVRALAKQGWRVRVAVRRTNMAHRMRMLGDVGQIQVVQANIRSGASVARALEGAQACVNLVGVLQERGRQGFMSLHATAAGKVAEAAKAAGATRFVQMSALGADAESGSKYARTKAMGEAAVRQVFPDAVVIRPSIVFGPEDGFFNLFARMATLAPALPLFGGGKTCFQPVFVGDVAAAIAATATQAGHAGKTFELGGPAVYSFKEVLELILRETGRNRPLIPIPWFAAKAMGSAGDMISGLFPAPITSDQVILLQSDNVVSGSLPGLAELGIVPTTVEAVVPSYLYLYRKGGQYAPLPEGAL
ncbi:complex I NDUFA9 subunit family protein [Caulobacter sp. NIBR2454]|uniref:complex I NDUFA9 subunit family protein n=1 Tax=Caulobacter sp. NIBR2454 TaxID=3015996 RepID=UPI0022B66678|nr:complex I NDUFA9 subunit family protein [Caulobacter sp. NIBR2454]